MRDNMENTPKDVFDAEQPNVHVQQTPSKLNELHAKKIVEDNKDKKENGNAPEGENYSLNDDRRVKVLSPGALVAKRFFRNRLAVTGLTILVIMFVFSFIGGFVSPYGEKEIFYRDEYMLKEYAGAVENTEFRYASAPSGEYNSIIQAQSFLAISTGKTEFTYRDVTYTVQNEGEDFYSIFLDNKMIGIAFKDSMTPSKAGEVIPFEVQYSALKAYVGGETSFTIGGEEYTISDGDVFKGGEEYAYISRYVIQAIMPDVFLSRDFKNALTDAIEARNGVLTGSTTFEYTDDKGEVCEYTLEYDAPAKNWEIKRQTLTTNIATYSYPSMSHWLGTDRNGMDMLTRLMYGGRVSLVIGFVVVIIETVIGVALGGLAGYFGKWVDNLIMRIVDVFYCVPSTPIIIIIGAAMDHANLDPQIRMLYLMLILGFLGWPGIARLVRGQILSLREQEFMTATEACGVRVSRRIFKHLIPNVIPQLIVTCTMGLGSTIITEATLSFLGLGVRFPFASWGNIINDVNNTHVLTTYWFIWIPAGVCLLLTVLAFNLVGDGLRDAFDPKMKR